MPTACPSFREHRVAPPFVRRPEPSSVMAGSVSPTSPARTLLPDASRPAGIVRSIPLAAPHNEPSQPGLEQLLNEAGRLLRFAIPPQLTILYAQGETSALDPRRAIVAPPEPHGFASGGTR